MDNTFAGLALKAQRAFAGYRVPSADDLARSRRQTIDNLRSSGLTEARATEIADAVETGLTRFAESLVALGEAASALIGLTDEVAEEFLDVQLQNTPKE